jgi:cyclopropane fatty-acyl-phospholipid synthase-like methyltransferase
MSRDTLETTGASNDTVEDHYDSPALRLGPILFDEHLHWGYWDEATREISFGAAAEAMCNRMIDRTEVGAGERFVDLGCGIGHPALKLAQARKCHVTGVTVSGYQQRVATEKAEQAGLSDKLEFLHADARNVPLPDNSFDGGWFFESIFHMGHAEALSEAARLLKPGAGLVLTDLPTLPHTTPEFMDFVHEHIHSVFIPDDRYPDLMKTAGFELLEIEDISQNVMPWLEAKLRESVAEHWSDVVRLMGDQADKAVDNWYYLFEYMAENLGYTMITARRL